MYADARAVDSLRTFAASERAVQWNGDYLDDYRLDPTALTLKTGAYSIQLIKDEEANAATLSLLEQLKNQDSVVQETLGYVNVVAYLPQGALAQLVGRPDVVSIQGHSEPTQRDERQDMIISGHLSGTGPSGPGYLAWLQSKGFDQAQFTASGFGVDVTDSGIGNGTPTPNHFGLYVMGDVLGVSRVIYNRLEGTPHAGSTLEGCDGHGNINAHIIGGYINGVTGAPWTDAEGYLHGLGVAPWVKVGSSVIFDPNTYTSRV